MSKYTFIARSQKFAINVRGLKPDTQHYLYFNRELQPNTQTAPFNDAIGIAGKRGDPLITNADGWVDFDAYWDAGENIVTSLEQAQEWASQVAGQKEVVVADVNMSTLPDNFRDIFSSYSVSYITVNVLL
jgi:hypothetical protein